MTLERNGRLCGCIGRLAADRPLWKTVVSAAIGAAVGDLRFRSVRPDEVDALQVEISVLTPLRPVADASEIVLGQDGIVLSKGGRSATFLPHVATEMRWDLAATLSHLAQKAGLGDDEWREGATLQVFQAEVLEEPCD